jgi:hypothetical protein
MAKNVELHVWATWSVLIPGSFCDPLDYDTNVDLIAMLHKHGAKETTDYSSIVVEYDVETEAEAFALCKAALTEMFPDLSITQEEPEDDDPIQAYLKRMAERGDDEAKSLLG